MKANEESMLMIITKDYQILRHNHIYYINNLQKALCPNCNSPLKVHDSRKRHLIIDSGDTLIFRLRRLKCPHCHTLHLELPDIMQPHKHYSLEVITHTLDQTSNNCPADDSTIYRWRYGGSESSRRTSKQVCPILPTDYTAYKAHTPAP